MVVLRSCLSCSGAGAAPSAAPAAASAAPAGLGGARAETGAGRVCARTLSAGGAGERVGARGSFRAGMRSSTGAGAFRDAGGACAAEGGRLGCTVVEAAAAPLAPADLARTRAKAGLSRGAGSRGGVRRSEYGGTRRTSRSGQSENKGACAAECGRPGCAFGAPPAVAGRWAAAASALARPALAPAAERGVSRTVTSGGRSPVQDRVRVLRAAEHLGRRGLLNAPTESQGST